MGPDEKSRVEWVYVVVCEHLRTCRVRKFFRGTKNYTKVSGGGDGVEVTIEETFVHRTF